MSHGRRSLRTHLAAAIGLIVVLSVGLTLVVGSVLTRRAVEEATLRGVSRQADLIAERESGTLLAFTRLPDLERTLAKQHERPIVTRLDRPSPSLPEWARKRLLDGRPANGKVGGDFFAARPVGNRVLVLLRPKSVGAASWRPFLWALVIAAAAAVALAALVSLWLARRLARPVRRVAAAARALAGGSAPEPLPLEGGGELAQLSQSFNEMAAQLERARAAERDFLLSVSHELKTPLTAIRGYAEGVIDEALPADDAWI